MKQPVNDGLESHHMPADSINNLPHNEGPAIQMDPADHAMTSSNGQIQGNRAYRINQKKLIDEGRFGEAIQMDIDDVRRRFGTKYDQAIKEMIDSLDPSMRKGLRE